MSYKKNIILDYIHTAFRNFNVTQGIWLIYLAQRGFSIFEIALFEGIFHVTSLLFEIPTGAIADVFGRKASRILGVLSYFIYIAILVNFNNFYVVGIGFVFCSLSYVFESGAGEALVYDSLIKEAQEHTFMKVNGRKEAIFQITSFVALMIGGTIAKVNPDYNFYMTGFFFALALLTIILMKEVPVEHEQKPTILDKLKEQFVISTKTVLKNKRLLLLIVIGALMTAPITTLFFFLQNYFDYQGVDIAYITIYIGLHAGASAIGGIFAHRLEHKFKEKKILYVIPLLMSIMFWLVLIDQIIVIPFILLGVLDSIFYVVLVDYINKMVVSKERATVLSFFGMMFSVVMIIIFTAIGYIIDLYDFNIAFMILAIIVSLFYMILLLVLKGNHLQQQE